VNIFFAIANCIDQQMQHDSKQLHTAPIEPRHTLATPENLFLKMPTSLLRLMFTFLSAREVFGSATSVCESWANEANDQYVVKTLVHELTIGPDHTDHTDSVLDFLVWARENSFRLPLLKFKEKVYAIPVNSTLGDSRRRAEDEQKDMMRFCDLTAVIRQLNVLPEAIKVNLLTTSSWGEECRTKAYWWLAWLLPEVVWHLPVEHFLVQPVSGEHKEKKTSRVNISRNDIQRTKVVFPELCSTLDQFKSAKALNAYWNEKLKGHVIRTPTHEFRFLRMYVRKDDFGPKMSVIYDCWKEGKLFAAPYRP
jgi:hypothetical protein